MSFSYVMMLLYWLERLSLHALYAFEDWSHVKRKFMTPEREKEKEEWLREFHGVYLCGCGVRDVLFGVLPRSHWSHMRLCAEALIRKVGE